MNKKFFSILSLTAFIFIGLGNASQVSANSCAEICQCSPYNIPKCKLCVKKCYSDVNDAYQACIHGANCPAYKTFGAAVTQCEAGGTLLRDRCDAGCKALGLKIGGTPGNFK